MAKRKKGSKTVPKGKALLGELPLPTKSRSASFISPADAESPSKMAMPPVTATSEESQASKGRVKSQASINGGGMDTAKQMKRDNEISKGILFKTPFSEELARRVELLTSALENWSVSSCGRPTS
jgi:hypothetical protein